MGVEHRAHVHRQYVNTKQHESGDDTDTFADCRASAQPD